MTKQLPMDMKQKNNQPGIGRQRLTEHELTKIVATYLKEVTKNHLNPVLNYVSGPMLVGILISELERNPKQANMNGYQRVIELLLNSESCMRIVKYLLQEYIRFLLYTEESTPKLTIENFAKYIPSHVNETFTLHYFKNLTKVAFRYPEAYRFIKMLREADSNNIDTLRTVSQYIDNTDILRFVHEFISVFITLGSSTEDIGLISPNELGAPQIEGLIRYLYKLKLNTAKRAQNTEILETIQSLSTFFYGLFENLKDPDSEIGKTSLDLIIKLYFPKDKVTLLHVYFLQSLVKNAISTFEYIIAIMQTALAENPYISLAIEKMFDLTYPVELNQFESDYTDKMPEHFVDLITEGFWLEDSITKVITSVSHIQDDLFTMYMYGNLGSEEIAEIKNNHPELISDPFAFSFFLFRVTDEDAIVWYEFIDGVLVEVTDFEIAVALYSHLGNSIQIFSQMLQEQKDLGKIEAADGIGALTTIQIDKATVNKPPKRKEKFKEQVTPFPALVEAAKSLQNSRSHLITLTTIYDKSVVRFICENCGLVNGLAKQVNKIRVGNLHGMLQIELLDGNGHSIGKTKFLVPKGKVLSGGLRGWYEYSGGRSASLRLYHKLEDGKIYISNKNNQAQDFKNESPGSGYRIDLNEELEQ